MAVGVLGAVNISVGRPWYGTGQDGDIVLDGVTEFAAFATRAGAVYTLIRDVYAHDLTLNVGVELRPYGYRIYASGELENRGTISRRGADSTSRSGAQTVFNPSASLGGDSDGGFGADGGQNGLAGSQGELRSHPYYGGNSGGGGQSSTAVLGGAGRLASAATGGAILTAGQPRNLFSIATGYVAVAGGLNYLRGGHGGGGGGAAVGVFGNGSGGGGEGGGVVLIAAYEITNAGTITAAGGNGRQALAADSGGGGGGAGAVILMAYDVLTNTGTITAAGGLGGAGFGGGTAGAAGTAGQLITIDNTGY